MTSPTHRCVITGGFGLLGQGILLRLASVPEGRIHVMVVDKNLYHPRSDDIAPSTTTSTVVVGDDSTTVGIGNEGRRLGCGTTSFANGTVATAAAAPATAATAVVSVFRGDLASADVADAIKGFADGDGRSLSVFHLASVMSGQGEGDFDEALRVNIDGTRSLLETCREIGGRPRFVFASSIAAFGGGSSVVNDETKLLPETTYGMTKACAELLVNDCTRKGFVDGRIGRLPTVVVRPGPPNPAATGCFSSVPKAVLHGQHFVSPVSPDLRHPCVGLSSAVQGLIRLHDASEADMGSRDRAVTLPAVSLTLRDLEKSASKLARDLGRPQGTVSYERDIATEAIVTAMPSAVEESRKARDIGLRADRGVDDIINEYIEGGWLQ